MSGFRQGEGAVRGRVDGEGNLVSADAPLADLHQRAGGLMGGMLAIPQIAALARLAGKLDLPISRAVIAADGDRDLDLWVQAEPEDDDVKLAIGGWTLRPNASTPPVEDTVREHDFYRAEADWLWETDKALRLISISAEAEPIVGDIRGFIGQPLTGLFRFVEGEAGDLPILNALAEHRRFENQLALLRRENEPKVMLAAIPLIDGNGRFVGFRGTSKNVEIVEDTPVVDAQASVLPPSSEALPDAFGRQLNRALKSPLDRIVASAESIQSQIDGPIRTDYAEYAGDIASAGRHLLGLVDDLVDLQSVESDDFQPTIEPLDLADIARSAAGLLSIRATEKSIRIDRPADDEMLSAVGDYKRVLQILVNLIGNAVRFAPGDSQVWIRCEQEGDLAAVIVADQGRGIAAEDHEKIFEKFERLSAEEPGSGLGLYLSRRLARAMNGDIAVDSAPGQGARFVLTLPSS